MHLFEKEPPVKNEYLKKYIKMASRFQNSGIVIVVLAVAVNYFFGSTLAALSYILFAVGGIALVFGGSSLRPHNLVKAFAQQCSREPNRIIAEGLLEAMERNRKTALTKNSIKVVQMAIDMYQLSPEADKELAARLRATADTTLSKKFF